MSERSDVIEWPELPDCGVYQHWPQDGTGWIHPDDVVTVESLIPSQRVFRRVQFDGTFYTLQYGELTVRVLPTLWLSVPDEKILIGDPVEVLAVQLERDPIIATVQDITYDSTTTRIHYTLLHRDMPLDRAYLLEELRLLSQRVELRDHLPEQVIQTPPEE